MGVMGAVRQDRAFPKKLRMRKFDPLLPFKIGPVNGQKARESGLWLKAWVAPEAGILG
jgi:hypothetical protein